MGCNLCQYDLGLNLSNFIIDMMLKGRRQKAGGRRQKVLRKADLFLVGLKSYY
ncbi:MAG: hypothetical protein F6K41_23945 [Symploca sp. SIO3E6]|nr:hypothetical protein [Caldora sp. SIO3E6]